MGQLFARREVRRARRRPASPANLPDDEHVSVVPVAGPRILLMPGLLKANARHRRPRVGDVARDAPQVAADLLPPLPYVSPAVLTERVHEVAIQPVERRAHDHVGLLQPRQRRLLARSLDVGVRAPVVLDVIEPPLRPRARVLLFVLIAAREPLLAGARTR